jgi:pimeloyl-ACP methyl ester carboxylesterase
MTDGLLLLHAFPLDASMWQPQVDAFGPWITTVAPNAPGFGGADPVGPATTMAEAADAARHAMAQADLDRAVVCGLSMGGYVALEFWKRHRDAVAGLVLANTRAGADDDAGRERRQALASRLRAEGNGFLVENPPPLLSANAPAELWDRVRDIIREQPAEAIAAASMGMAERSDFTGELGRIDVPTLVVTADGDTLIPPAATTPMADAIPGAELSVLAGAGHLSNLEASEEFTALLRAFMERCGIKE